MATTKEETGLTTRTEQTFELAPTAGAAEKQFEIQSAIVIAKRFPRNEDAAFEKLMKAAKRVSFAEDAAYSFPRGGTTVEGPSVNLAREAARVWGNVRFGLDIIRDDEESRQIRAWAWDMETNVRVSAEDDFKKLVQRKQKGQNGQSSTIWMKPDERDLRELTNRRGAIVVRNCLLQIVPKDLIEDAMARCKETIRKGAEQDPEAARKRLILAFSELNISPEMLESSLGHKLAECSPAEVANLRNIYKSIADGNSTWQEYANPQPKKEPEKGSIDITDLSKGKEENRGHGDENLSAASSLSETTANKTHQTITTAETSGLHDAEQQRKADLEQLDKQQAIESSNGKQASAATNGKDQKSGLTKDLFAGRRKQQEREPGQEG